MKGLKIYRNEAGEKLYPVCSWERNQHKLYNALDRAHNRQTDEDYSEASCAEVERCEAALEAFDRHIINGLVYATYSEGKVIKDIITAYDCRTDYLRYTH